MNPIGTAVRVVQAHPKASIASAAVALAGGAGFGIHSGLEAQRVAGLDEANELQKAQEYLRTMDQALGIQRTPSGDVAREHGQRVRAYKVKHDAPDLVGTRLGSLRDIDGEYNRPVANVSTITLAQRLAQEDAGRQAPEGAAVGAVAGVAILVGAATLAGAGFWRALAVGVIGGAALGAGAAYGSTLLTRRLG